jgi:hypothetical protein
MVMATLLGGVAALWFFVAVGARVRRNRKPVRITNVVCRATPGSDYAPLRFRIENVSSKRVVIPTLYVSVVSHEPIAAPAFSLHGLVVLPFLGRVAVAAQVGDYQIILDVPLRNTVFTPPTLSPEILVMTGNSSNPSHDRSTGPPRPKRTELGQIALMPGEADDFLVDAHFESPVRYRFCISALVEGAKVGREKRVSSEEVVVDVGARAGAASGLMPDDLLPSLLQTLASRSEVRGVDFRGAPGVSELEVTGDEVSPTRSVVVGHGVTEVAFDERATDVDNVNLRNGDILSGTILTGEFTVQASYGTLTFTKEQLQSITVENAAGKTDQVLLKVGDRLSGVLQNASIQMTHSSGATITLEKGDITSITFARAD